MKTKILLLALISMIITNSNLKAQAPSAQKKILIAYYSHSGNTRTVAEQMAKATGGDIFEIQPTTAYPSDYQAVVDKAKKEIAENYKPALKNRVKNMASYDVIIIGSPCWWSTIAPPVATFLSGYDLSGKTVAPFMTHEGSRLGRSVSDIQKLCPGSAVLEGLPIRGGSVNNSGAEVSAWLKKLKIID